MDGRRTASRRGRRAARRPRYARARTTARAGTPAQTARDTNPISNVTATSPSSSRVAHLWRALPRRSHSAAPTSDVSYNVTLWQSADLRFLWRVAKSPQCEERGGSRADQSSDTSASWITLAQSCVSAANSLAASALVLPIGSICSLLRMASAVAGSWTTSATSLLILSAIAAGVAGGATMAYQVTARKPVSPASAIVGTSGRPDQRSELPVAMMLTCFV